MCYKDNNNQTIQLIIRSLKCLFLTPARSCQTRDKIPPKPSQISIPGIAKWPSLDWLGIISIVVPFWGYVLILAELVYNTMPTVIFCVPYADTHSRYNILSCFFIHSSATRLRAACKSVFSCQNYLSFISLSLIFLSSSSSSLLYIIIIIVSSSGSSSSNSNGNSSSSSSYNSSNSTVVIVIIVVVAGLPQVREKSGKKIFFQGQGKVREI